MKCEDAEKDEEDFYDPETDIHYGNDPSQEIFTIEKELTEET